MCMIDGCDEPVTMIHDGETVARKAHKCSECRREIAKGETYLREVFKFDGELSLHKTCSHCEVARRWLNHECGGWIFGAVAEDIHEHVNEGYYGFAVKKLSIGISRKWQRKDGRLWPIPALPKSGPSLAHA